MEDGRFKKALNEALSVVECDEYVAFEPGGKGQRHTFNESFVVFELNFAFNQFLPSLYLSTSIF